MSRKKVASLKLSERTISVFDTVGTYFVNKVYMHLYNVASKEDARTKAGTITDSYKKHVLLYAQGIRDPKCYKDDIQGLLNYWSRFASPLIDDMIDTILGEFIPEEHFSNFTVRQKETAMFDIVSSSVKALVTFVLKSENLMAVIDERDNPTTVGLFQEAMLQIFATKRNEYYNKFTEAILGEKSNPADKAIIRKLENEKAALQMKLAEMEQCYDTAMMRCQQIMSAFTKLQDQLKNQKSAPPSFQSTSYEPQFANQFHETSFEDELENAFKAEEKPLKSILKNRTAEIRVPTASQNIFGGAPSSTQNKVTIANPKPRNIERPRLITSEQSKPKTGMTYRYTPGPQTEALSFLKEPETSTTPWMQNEIVSVAPIIEKLPVVETLPPKETSLDSLSNAWSPQIIPETPSIVNEEPTDNYADYEIDMPESDVDKGIMGAWGDEDSEGPDEEEILAMQKKAMENNLQKKRGLAVSKLNVDDEL